MQKTERAKFQGGGEKSVGYDRKDGITEEQVRALVRICARSGFLTACLLSCRKPSGQSFRVVAKSPWASTARTASPMTR
jgi:hypothetical protein